MKKEVSEKLSALDPRFKQKIEELFKNINNSIDLLYEAAIHDEKTGLYNNKFFETILTMEMEKAKRGKQKLSLFIIDIDFFKKINDTYGHIKADELLARLAYVVKSQIRKSDIAARFGGEEFVILLPETSIEKGKKLTARLREAIKTDSFLKKANLTVSGGLTEYKEKDTAKKFKERADIGLYKAKQTGRDKFVAIK
jgi:diguanylate cyclase (GGDEF)-like protein